MPQASFHRLLLAAALLLSSLAVLAQKAPLDYVNPFIGTAGGNTYPGAQAPFGMISVSPNNTFQDYDDAFARPGYQYTRDRIAGFGLTHFSGVGCHAMQDLLFMPVAGALAKSPVHNKQAYTSAFSHTNEHASPGFYQVDLPDYQASVKFAARQRAALGELTFGSTGPASFVFAPTNSANGISAGNLRVDAARRTLTGQMTTGGFCWRDPALQPYTVYFALEFDAPITEHGVWKGAQQRPGADTVSGKELAAYLTFGPRRGRPVRVKAAISFVSVANAQLNARTEIPGWDVEQVRRQTQADWAQRLSQLTIRAGGTPDERTSFYTAIYHNLLQPNVFEDVNGEYVGFDYQRHKIEPGHSKYVNFSLWDVYRTSAHLQALVAPREASDFVRSLLLDAQQGGAFPNWSMNNQEYGVMNGYSPFPYIANLHAMGATDFDLVAVKEMMKKVSTTYQGCQGRHGWLNLDEYKSLGYVPVDKNGLGTSMTEEYGIDDYAIAKICQAAGDAPAAAYYLRRSQNVFTLYNPQTGFLQGRTADGRFQTPFDSVTTKGFNEGNATQYFWSVPQSTARLVALAGRPAVERRLDRFLATVETGWAPEKPHYWIGNEPCFGASYVYNYLRAPWKAQYQVHRLARNYFKNRPDGLPGDDDVGAMSALYVFSALGLYPYVPGESGFTLTGPVFEQVALQRPNGKTVVINGKGAGPAAPYIQGLRVNGQPTSRLWLDWATLNQAGGVLDFDMRATPNKSWGAAAQDAPPSYQETP